MPFAVVFTLFSVACAALAVAHGGWAWLLLWPAASFAVVAAAYARGRPGLLGKRPTGSLHPAAVGVHLPFLALTWGVWRTVGTLHGSRDASRVAEGLWVGRRPRPRDLPPGVTVIADLTSEFALARGLAGRFTYLSFPILDGHVPTLAALVAIARAIAAQPGVVYLHCAQGHGRSAMVAACVLIARGAAADPEEAMAIVRSARPRVRLTRRQAALLRAAAGELGALNVVDATTPQVAPPPPPQRGDTPAAQGGAPAQPGRNPG